jgi:hypothetical protein
MRFLPLVHSYAVSREKTADGSYCPVSLSRFGDLDAAF